MNYTEICEKYGYLLSWSDAEKKVGRRLDYYSNFDECLYLDMLIKEMKMHGIEIKEEK